MGMGMGRLIVCSGKQAVTPYLFKLTDTKIYSIEELCYYIYYNISDLNKENFQYSLCNWLKEELQLENLADTLKVKIEESAELKEIVTVIFTSCDYYSDIDIKQLISFIEEMEKITPFEKKKKLANNYLKYKQYAEAQAEYMDILNGKEVLGISTEEYGDILHNLAIVQLHSEGTQKAAGTFKEAYLRNHKMESLKLYLLALKISKQEELFLKEIEECNVDSQMQEQILDELESCMNAFEQSEEIRKVEQLKDYKTSGKMNHFYHTANELVESWKKQYRRENIC